MFDVDDGLPIPEDFMREVAWDAETNAMTIVYWVGKTHIATIQLDGASVYINIRGYCEIVLDDWYNAVTIAKAEHDRFCAMSEAELAQARRGEERNIAMTLLRQAVIKKFGNIAVGTYSMERYVALLLEDDFR
jgi:D-ribose pyranose/furanose isomerase RbsD